MQGLQTAPSGELPPIKSSNPALRQASANFLKQVVAKRRGPVEESVAIARQPVSARVGRTSLADLAEQQDVNPSLSGPIVVAGVLSTRMAPVESRMPATTIQNGKTTLADLYRQQVQEKAPLGSGQRVKAMDKKVMGGAGRGVNQMERRVAAEESVQSFASSTGASKAAMLMRKMNQPARY